MRGAATGETHCNHAECKTASRTLTPGPPGVRGGNTRHVTRRPSLHPFTKWSRDPGKRRQGHRLQGTSRDVGDTPCSTLNTGGTDASHLCVDPVHPYRVNLSPPHARVAASTGVCGRVLSESGVPRMQGMNTVYDVARGSAVAAVRRCASVHRDTHVCCGRSCTCHDRMRRATGARQAQAHPGDDPPPWNDSDPPTGARARARRSPSHVVPTSTLKHPATRTSNTDASPGGVTTVAHSGGGT